MSETVDVSQGGTGSVESLKRVKEMEVATEAQLAKLRADGEALLKELLRKSEEAIEAARAEAEKARLASISAGRSKAEAEASALLAEGRKAAQLIELKVAKTVAAKRDSVLSVILGEFRGKNGGA